MVQLMLSLLEYLFTSICCQSCHRLNFLLNVQSKLLFAIVGYWRATGDYSKSREILR